MMTRFISNLINLKSTARLFCVALAASSLPLVAGAEDAAMSRIKSTHEVRVGFRGEEAPFSMQSGSDAPAGFAVELCAKVVEHLQTQTGPLTVKMVNVTANERLAAFQSGAIDMLCAETSVSLSRRKLANFSIPIYFDGISAIVSNNASERAQQILSGETPRFRPGWRASLADIFANTEVVVVDQTAAQDWVQNSIKSFRLPTTVVSVADRDNAVTQLHDGKALAYFDKHAVLQTLMNDSNLSDDFYIVPKLYTRQPIAIAFAPGSDELTLVADEALSALYRSGEIMPIYEKYFGPASSEVRDLYDLATIPE